MILKSNEEQSTKGSGHDSVLKFGDNHFILYHPHNQPHEDAGGVFRQACADRMAINEDGTIEPVVPILTGIGALLPLVAQGQDVARGKYATTTSVRKGAHVAE